MGAFVLGVLVGWLAEWLFYTFWVKAGDDDGDCSNLKTELELKNRQISSLQSQLSSTSESAVSKVEVKSISSSSSQKVANASAEKTTAKKASIKTSKSKPTVIKKSAKASVARISTTKKSPPAKKPTTKATVAKSATTKGTAKRKAGGDDFTKLNGIGPSMSVTLNSLGIDTFKKLAETDDDILRDMLEASGARMNNNKEAMDSWNEQATVAATGNFKALKAMQAALKR